MLALALAGVVVLILAGDLAASLQAALLMVLPVLALAVVLLTRPYLGERTLARLRARCGHRPREQARRGSPQRPAALVPARGGRLIAVALAGRAPPLGCSVCR